MKCKISTFLRESTKKNLNISNDTYSSAIEAASRASENELRAIFFVYFVELLDAASKLLIDSIQYPLIFILLQPISHLNNEL